MTGKKTRIVHIAGKNSLAGGVGTILDYLQEGLNATPDLESHKLITTTYRRKIGGTKENPEYETKLGKITDQDGRNISPNNLENIVRDYDIVHVHGIPGKGVLEALSSAKKKSPNIKIVNTAHSSVKSELMAQYEYTKEKERKLRGKGKSLRGKDLYEKKALDYLIKQNILNNPARFNQTYWGSAIHRQEKIMTLADAVQHMNEAYKNQIIKEYSAEENASKHVVIPNGVKVPDLNNIPDRPKKKRLLFVGRFSKEKGIEELVNSLPYILKEHPDAEIRIVGGDKEGKLTEEYKQKAINKIKKYFVGEGDLEKILSRVTFTGWVSDKKELREHYLWSDYVIIPSYAESFSLTATEALMYKRIPIITATPALKNLYIDKGIAIGIAPKNRTGIGIANKVNQIFSEKNSKEQDYIAQKGHEYVKQNYTYDNMIKKQKKLYKRLMTK